MSQDARPTRDSPADTEWNAARIDATHNTARFFVENRAVSWVLLIGCIAWGIFGYNSMPKQKDPTIPVRVALAVTSWPGVDAQRIEMLVTRPIEEKIAENSTIYPSTPSDFGIQSITLPGLSIVQVQLDDRISDVETELNDINLRLLGLNSTLPPGAGPIQWNSGFGQTAALMLTVASPPERKTALELRAETVATRLAELRAGTAGQDGHQGRVSLVLMLPRAGDAGSLEPLLAALARRLEASGVGSDARVLAEPGFAAIDFQTTATPDDVLADALAVARDEFEILAYHPDAWQPVAVGDLAELASKLDSVRGARFTYRELDDFTDLVSRQIQGAPQVSKVLRSGVIPERVEFEFSQDDLAAVGVSPQQIAQTLAARDTVLAGGRLQASGSEIVVSPTGDFRATREIENVMVGRSASGSPLYLRQLGKISRIYQDPPSTLNYYRSRMPDGTWARSPAITLAVQMREGEQIAAFSDAVNEVLQDIQARLPEELIFARTSDQPQQVEDNINLFMGALYEAVLIVIIVAFIGFRDWRSSVLLMISIPLTLSMTFGMISLLGVDLHQISIATLIIALGLLVDDPVVASDAIKRGLAAGEQRSLAAWLGPTRLSRAILFATITNVAAYLPFLLLTGTTGTFLWSLPVVMAAALISSRIVSMTFIPFLAFHLLRAPARPEPPMEIRRTTGASGRYYRFVKGCLERRFLVLAIALTLMAGGFALGSRLVTAFFPSDVQHLFTVDVWLPSAYGVPASDEVTNQVEEEMLLALESLQDSGVMNGELVSITSFVGQGGPRFWQSISPEPMQPHYAQLVVEVSDMEDTPDIVYPLQRALSARIPGAEIDVRQLELNPVSLPIALLLSSRGDAGDLHSDDDLVTIRQLADQLTEIVRGAPSVERVRHDWLNERYRVQVGVDPDLANLAGVSNTEVARALQGAYDGVLVSSLHDAYKTVPVVMRMRRWERPSVHDLENLYVYPSDGSAAVPLGSIATLETDLTTEKIRRREHFRTVTVFGFPREGHLPSEVIAELEDELADFSTSLPPGFLLQVGGEHYKQQEGFSNMAFVMGISALCIFVALVVQFSSLVKPWIVLAGVPFGFAGGLVALYLTNQAFGFMAFLGLVSLAGVIVSHVIVLNDFIEERLSQGEPLIESLLDAGLLRLRPVLITVAATVLALVPLAREGGPLWQPLCFAQMGGLTVATFISLLIVPILYAICVLDLKVIKLSSPVSREA